MLKVDKDGNFSWARVFGPNMDAPTGHDFTNASVCEAANGDLILAGLNYNYNEVKNAWLLRFTSCGALLDDRIYAGIADDILDKVAGTVDNGGVAVGYSYSYGGGALKMPTSSSLAKTFRLSPAAAILTARGSTRTPRAKRSCL